MLKRLSWSTTMCAGGEGWKGKLEWWVLIEMEIKSDVCLKQAEWLSLVFRKNCYEYAIVLDVAV